MTESIFKQLNIRALLIGVDNVIVQEFQSQLHELAIDFLTWVKAQPDKPAIVLISNQGGVGLRYWMETEQWGEPGKFPSEDQAKRRLTEIQRQVTALTGETPLVVKCYAYYSARSEKWAPVPDDVHPINKMFWEPTWRMPNSGMIKYAIQKLELKREEVAFIGLNKEEFMAAMAADIRFIECTDIFVPDPGQINWDDYLVSKPSLVDTPDELTEDEIPF